MSIARHFAVLLLLALATLDARAQVAYQDNFDGGLSAGWTFKDGYATQFPSDQANHAVLAFAPSHLSISFAGGTEHNMWWMRQAQVIRPYLGSGVYETKVDSALTGDQQFGLIFQTGPATFMVFMLYSYTNNQIRAYVERFAWSQAGGVNKTTFDGGGLGLPMPSAGPFHIRVEVSDNANPASRSWKFSWSRDGGTWTNLLAGVLEGSGAHENIGAIADVGVFVGNQPQSYSAFDARFDYFRYYASPLHLPVGKVNVATRASDRRVDLWWDPVESAQQYAVYLLGAAGTAPSLIGRTTSTAFADLNLANGVTRTYSIVAERDGVQGNGSDPIAATPNVSPIDALPTAGMLLSLSASDLAANYQNGAAISIWPNARGPFTTASATAAGRPTLVHSAVNGQPALRFDGVDDHLTLPAGFQDFTAGISLFVVTRSSSTGGAAKVLMLGNGAGQANVSFGRTNAGLQYYTNNELGEYGWFNTQDAIVPGEVAMLSVIQNPSVVGTMPYAAVGKNGAMLNGQNVFVPPLTARNLNYIGKSYWSSDAFFKGDIAEILLYDRKLSASEQTVVHNYLAQKYGVTLAPGVPLGVPSGLNASAGNGVVGLSWGSVVDAISYRVYRRTDATGPFDIVRSATGTSYSDTTVVNGTTYYYAVAAHDGVRDSEISSWVMAAPAVPFTPAPNPALPSAGLMLALDAEVTAMQYGNGMAVPVWLDRSGNARNATASGTSLPMLVTNAINGRPALRFDGVDDFLALPSGFSDFRAGISVYMVMRPTAVSGGAKLLLLGNGAAQDNVGMGRNGGGSGLQYFTTNNVGAYGWFPTSEALVTGEAAMVSLMQEPGAANAFAYAELAKNGVVLAGQNVFVPPVVTRNANFVGKSFWSSDAFFKGEIAELIVYNRKLTAQEHAAVRSYLHGKYGL